MHSRVSSGCQSCGQRHNRWPAKTLDRCDDVHEDLPGQRGGGDLEDGIASMADEARTGLDQPLAAWG